MTSEPLPSSSNSNSNSNSINSSNTANPEDDSTVSKSNYYFFKSTPAEEAVKYKPQLIDESQLKVEQQQQQNSNAGSKWNAAGTWEERDLSKWAHQRLSDLLLTVFTPDHAIRVTSIKSVSGDATIVFSRGKKKYGFDLQLTAEWTLMSSKAKSEESSIDIEKEKVKDKEKDKEKKKSNEICGKIILPSIDDSCDGDYEIRFSCEKESDEAVAALHAIKRQKQRIIKLIDQFVEEFKQQ